MTEPDKARLPLSRRPASRALAAVLLPVLLAPGCESLRETAGTGQDLLENPARTAVVRAPAGIGAIAGYVLAVPCAAVLVPTVWMPDTYVRNADQGDIYISPVSASFDYGHGIGAAILGYPFKAFEGLFRDEPTTPPPGTVPEERELPPNVPDADFDFSVRPLVVSAPESPAAAPGADVPEPAPREAPAAESSTQQPGSPTDQPRPSTQQPPPEKP